MVVANESESFNRDCKLAHLKRKCSSSEVERKDQDYVEDKCFGFNVSSGKQASFGDAISLFIVEESASLEDDIEEEEAL